MPVKSLDMGTLFPLPNRTRIRVPLPQHGTPWTGYGAASVPLVLSWQGDFLVFECILLLGEGLKKVDP